MSHRSIPKSFKGKIIATLIAATLSTNISADSPPNITTDIKWTDEKGEDIHSGTPPPPTFGSVAIIEAAFNNARRQEEIQLGLTSGTIANLDLPSQAVWDGLTDEQKALYLLNDERTSRHGMIEGVIGLPFAGVEGSIDGISETYADVLIANDAVGHNQPSLNAAIDGIDARLDKSATLADCHSNLTRGENLAWFGVTAGDSIPLPIERSIYRWIYDDSGSAWGHREMALLQDKPLTGGLGGFTNDNGESSHEGYLGFSSKGAAEYTPWGANATSFAQIVVMHFFDPKPDGGADNCSFTVENSNMTENLPKPTDQPANSAPVAADDTVTTDFNTASTTINVLSNDSDPDSDVLSVTANSSPSNGTVVKTGNTFVYTPGTDFSGSDSFTYNLSDGTAEATGTVNITVNASTDPSTDPSTDTGANPPTTTTDSSGGGSTGLGMLAFSLLGGLALIRRKLKLITSV